MGSSHQSLTSRWIINWNLLIITCGYILHGKTRACAAHPFVYKMLKKVKKKTKKPHHQFPDCFFCPNSTNPGVSRRSKPGNASAWKVTDPLIIKKTFPFSLSQLINQQTHPWTAQITVSVQNIWTFHDYCLSDWPQLTAGVQFTTMRWLK